MAGAVNTAGEGGKGLVTAGHHIPMASTSQLHGKGMLGHFLSTITEVRLLDGVKPSGF